MMYLQIDIIKFMPPQSSSFIYTDQLSPIYFMKLTIRPLCILAFVCTYIPNRTKIEIIKYKHNNIQLKICKNLLQYIYFFLF